MVILTPFPINDVALILPYVINISFLIVEPGLVLGIPNTSGLLFNPSLKYIFGIFKFSSYAKNQYLLSASVLFIYLESAILCDKYKSDIFLPSAYISLTTFNEPVIFNLYILDDDVEPIETL